MITLITGLPGNGKTLFALWHIKHLAERGQREVYYHNIKDLSLPWTACEPEKWMDLPHGSVIVLDEAQFVFSKKPNGAKLPEWYEQLATHRHKGFDIFLITQHPSLVDNFVRQLVGQHYHVVRKFGLSRATVYEWSSANAGPQLASSQKSAIPLKWAYPKEVYGYYKSAEIHTVKRSVPGKIILASIFVLAVPVLGYWTLDRFQNRNKADPVVTQAAQSSTQSPAGGLASQSQAAAIDPLADAKAYMFANTPRVVGLPQTAPKYDQLTVPIRVPVPAMCVQVGSVGTGSTIRCKCFTQQGTPMDVQFNMCIEIARNGTFQDFEPDPTRRTDTPPVQASTPPSVSSSAPVVLAMNDVSGPSLKPLPPTPLTESRRVIGRSSAQ